MVPSNDPETVDSSTYQIAQTRIPALFPRSYEGSRARFRRSLDKVRQFWPKARLKSYRLEGDEELTIDWIEADGLKRADLLLALTLGEHGIEGYVGSAILQVFLDEYLPRLKAERTGLLLVHAINPWGMKYWRRVNQANVDLNRNFLWEPELTGETPGDRADSTLVSNLDYDLLAGLLNPSGALRSLAGARLRVLVGLVRCLAALGVRRLTDAALMGQYHAPEGMYFGGASCQQETRLLMDLFRARFEPYAQILHLDMHTGYGPRYQMSLVNSPLEARSPDWFIEQVGYPLVLSSATSSFYQIQGDMIDFIYRLVQEEYPDKGLYATAFEFGTYGSSLLAGMRSLRTMILENQLHHYGTPKTGVRAAVEREFRELYFPQEARWQAKAVADARQALSGILSAEGFFLPSLSAPPAPSDPRA